VRRFFFFFRAFACAPQATTRAFCLLARFAAQRLALRSAGRFARCGTALAAVTAPYAARALVDWADVWRSLAWTDGVAFLRLQRFRYDVRPSSHPYVAWFINAGLAFDALYMTAFSCCIGDAFVPGVYNLSPFCCHSYFAATLFGSNCLFAAFLLA